MANTVSDKAKTQLQQQWQRDESGRLVRPNDTTITTQNPKTTNTFPDGDWRTQSYTTSQNFSSKVKRQQQQEQSTADAKNINPENNSELVVGFCFGGPC